MEDVSSSPSKKTVSFSDEEDGQKAPEENIRADRSQNDYRDFEV